MKLNKKQLGFALIVLSAIIIFGGFYLNKHYLLKNYSEQATAAAVVNSPSVKDIALSGITKIQPRGVSQTEKTLHLPILMYHHIGDLPQNPDAIRKDLTVPTQNFADQMQWLYSNGYHSITLNDVYLYSLGQFQIPTKPVVLTFDDGYSDAFTNALPILKQFGFIGSFEIITNNPGTTQGTNSYAGWDQVTSAQENGNEIVCHTENHFDGSNPKFTADYIYQNLVGCKQTLLSHGISTSVIVYPYGHYTSDYVTQAQKAGFTLGVTTHESDNINLNDLMEVPRVRVHGAETLQRFEDIILDKLPQTSTTPESLYKN